ncbi:protein translocase subunit SecD [Desulfonatronovibrio hydrogenovorans]|uniref:protein translocase subunit SecD n=1 Tax=Desulfonatronovibrio hydrogenovorans TaxID=53245 RepID=UPI00048D584E|nr:protein translocase subunit SecD [Desulfonatronovibrio hydrogenovorans]
MKGNLRWKIPVILMVLITSLLYFLPSFSGVRDSSLAKIMPDKQVSLGLDLRGGIHLTLGVEVERAMERSLAQMGQDIRDQARQHNILILRPGVTDDTRLEFVLVQRDQQRELDRLIDREYSNLRVVSRTAEDEQRTRYILDFTSEYKEVIRDMTMDQAVKTIRNRIDQFGVAEPDIRRQQEDRIQVQLPGLDDPQRAIAIIGQTAHLEFKLVDEDADPQRAEQGIVPPGSRLYYQQVTLADGTTVDEPVVLRAETVMTGEYITNAHTAFDQYNQPYVAIAFDNRGSRIFERVTGENVRKRLAIVLDGNVYSTPVIQERISGGRASITGRFTVDEAHDLAVVLRAGSLPAPVFVMEERTVGPSLGQESIERGVRSAMIGGALVIIFMIFYFGFAGLIADIVLAFNVILIMAGLAGFGATLTLPGIAGIILTIGIAVDANVLIFERIREELRRGLSPRAAVEEGYNRATLTILDANVTTIIAAVILYQFGTGPIRGFAVTLTLGVLASMFTAIFVSRVLFDIWVSRRKPGTAFNI